MEEIELSIFERGRGADELFQQIVNQFESAHRARVTITVIPWDDAWTQLVEIALHQHGPDVSEVGSTWVHDLVRMNAIEELRLSNMPKLGAITDFVQASRVSSGMEENHPVAWAVPGSLDTRCVYYRRDWLQQAGIDETTAFSSLGQFAATLEKLEQAGHAGPLGLSTTRVRTNVHFLASWVWGAGGDFISQDGAQILLDQPATLKGMAAYFELSRFLPRPVLTLNEAETLYLNGEVGVVLSGYWLGTTLRGMTGDLPVNTGSAPMPGPAFVGGVNWVTWKHSRKKPLATRLIEALTVSPTADILWPSIGLPTRVSLLKQSPYSTDPFLQTLGVCAQTGRTFSTQRLWGVIEKRLNDEIPVLWDRVQSAPCQEIPDMVQRSIDPIAQRLRMTLRN